jgi:hypothetical protein
VIGVTRMSGTSKKSGRPYDIARVLVLQPVQVGGSEQTMRAGFGFAAAELDLRPDALPKFSQVKFPAELELITGNEMMFGRLVTVVEDFRTPAAVARAA